MASCAFTILPNVGTYRTNALGYGIPSIPPPPRPLEPPCELPVCDGDYSRPRGYEEPRLTDFIAYPNDGLGEDNPLATMRILRSAGRFAIGTAVSTVTGEPSGFLLDTKTRTVIPLRYECSSGDVHVMICPRALLVRKGVVTVVGESLLDGERYPAIAYVRGGCVTIISGCDGECKSDSECECEEVPPPPSYTDVKYYDVIENPCSHDHLVICGSRRDRAAVFVVSKKTGAIVDTTSLYALGEDVTSLATCITLVSSCMFVVGVQAEESSSLLWTIAAETLQELNWTSGTSYNNKSTKRLRLPVNGLSVSIIRLFSEPSGVVYAVAVGKFSTYETNMPSYGSVVYKFTEDTEPDQCYGVAGISIWFDPRSTSTRPNDAVLEDGSIYVVGNSYSCGACDDGLGYANPCLPFLSVGVPRGYTSYPKPFLLQVRYDGCPCPLLNGLDGCAPALFANTVLVHATRATIIGDVWFHLGCPSQPAGLLLVEMLLKPCPRIVNCARVNVPVINIPDGCQSGPIVTDKLCGDTIFQVAGPVVVGCANTEGLCLPGSIAFDPVTKSFMGFDGTEWRSFTFESRV